LYFGTRPTFLVASLLQFATLIWSADAKSFNSLVAARTICAFAASCGEGLPAVVVRDLYFLHERGRWMGIYMVFFQGMGNVGAIISGFVIGSIGWRWHFWVMILYPKRD
jgi:MFS family permease